MKNTYTRDHYGIFNRIECVFATIGKTLELTFCGGPGSSICCFLAVCLEAGLASGHGLILDVPAGVILKTPSWQVGKHIAHRPRPVKLL